jgi:hypothetical protein
MINLDFRERTPKEHKMGKYTESNKAVIGVQERLYKRLGPYTLADDGTNAEILLNAATVWRGPSSDVEAALIAQRSEDAACKARMRKEKYMGPVRMVINGILDLPYAVTDLLRR